MDCEDDWQEFYDEVYDVTDLGSNVHASGIKEISEQDEVCLRAFTRAQVKSLVQDGNQVSQPDQENSRILKEDTLVRKLRFYQYILLKKFNYFREKMLI